MTLTIITINFNNKNGLGKTIVSIVSQRQVDFEWIVIDGGSTDGSKELIEDYSSNIAYWVSEPDTGVYNAMNKGIKASSGDYLIFMNSGDCFADEHVLKRTIKELDSDIVCGHVLTSRLKKKGEPPLSFTPWSLLRRNIPHQAEFIRRSLFSDIGLYAEDLRILSDLEFNLKSSLAGCSYKVIPYLIAVVEEGGISNTEIDNMKEEIKIIQERVLPRAIVSDYSSFTEMRIFSSYPAIKWAIDKKWPYKLIRILHSVFS